MGSLFVKLKPDAFPRFLNEARGCLGANDLIFNFYVEDVKGTQGLYDMDLGFDVVVPGFSGEPDRFGPDTQCQPPEGHAL